MRNIFIAITVLMLTACAGTSGNTAFVKAHEAHADVAKTEANATAKTQETLALAIASVAKGCETDACRMGAMMSYTSIKAQAESVVKRVAPVIKAPVNEAVEIIKDVLHEAKDIYSIRLGAAIKLGDMSRGAADKDVLNNALSTVDIIRNTDEVK